MATWPSTIQVTLWDDEHQTRGRQAVFLGVGAVAGTAVPDRAGIGRGADRAGVIAELRVNPVTVCKWRYRFVSDRLDGLTDAPRPGAARTAGDDIIDAVLVDTLE